MPHDPGAKPLVEVRGLNVRFVSREATVKAVNGVDFTLAQNDPSASWARAAPASRSRCAR
ncbi:hypothetical protein [Teichococcus aestuarii]|uniref:hypothetical protein n=1 Tax=Teichococcus aestuarii TaxID=568898 RepID=UPI0036108289